MAAAKQSHKGAIPQLDEALTVTEFLQQDHDGLKLICYCDEATGKIDIKEALSAAGFADARQKAGADRASKPKVTIMIGPEGDFSRAEVALALKRGWQPVSLGDSRLRIETAALVATTAVYLHFSR